MVSGFWGKKIGMTQIFAKDKVVPVTAIDISRWLVVGIKTEERDGYNAVKVGHPRARFATQAFSTAWLKSLKKHFQFVREIKCDKIPEGISVGDEFDSLGQVAAGAKVDVFGVTKGRGFAGVVRRHNFGGPPASHGATMGNKPGSIGFMTSQGKVIKGKKMPGHMGTCQRVMKNLELVKIDPEAKIVLVKGSVPGYAGSLVFVRKA